MKIFLCLFLLLASCGKTPDKPDPKDPVPTVEERYQEAEARLKAKFLENNWIVSRKPDGSPEHQGEGLIWDGTYLTVAKCDDTAIEDMLIEMIERRGGALVRYEPLGEYENGREVTLDGAIGLYRGIVSRVARCPDAAAKWDLAVTLHRQYLAENDQVLNVAADAKLIAGFDILPDVVAGYKDLSTGPLLVQLVAWSAAVKATQSAAYRINLSFLAIQTLEEAGYVIPGIYRSGFCAATNGVDIPTVDHWCGRGDLAKWINEFQFNQWEYRHQRSGAWETPDAAPDETPGLDFLVAVRQLYK